MDANTEVKIKYVQTHIEPNLYRGFKVKCAEKDITMRDFLREAIRKEVEGDETTPKD